MDLHVNDAGYVRAPAAATYRLLADIASWPAWWPSVEVDRLQPGGDDRWQMGWGRGRRRLRFEARAHRWREDIGFCFAVTGDLEGTTEFWLEPGHGGTIIHHIVAAEDRRGSPRATLTLYRRHLRRGLWAAKDRLQSDVREGLGLLP